MAIPLLAMLLLFFNKILIKEDSRIKKNRKNKDI